MRFKDYIQRIHLREAERLDENRKQYEQMFQSLLQLGGEKDTWGIDDVRDTIKYYKNKYKRQDRIIWALRWHRVWLALNMMRKIEKIFSTEELQNNGQRIIRTLQKIVNDTVNKTDSHDKQQVEYQSDYFRSRDFQIAIDHYLGMMDTVEPLNNVVFDRQTPLDIEQQLQRIEDEWKETRKREIPPADEFYENAEKVLDFNNGFAWWNLNTKWCSTEGDAMGHCGNTGTPKAGDSILSLRQEVERNGQRYHVPHLTFILDQHGRLGEMKGRGNEKPSKKYHPYIVELLKQPWVEGVKGGGYMPQKNFSMNDLDEETRKQLIQLNPDLESFIDKYNRLGFTNEVERDLHKELRMHGLPDIWEIRDNTVYLEHWKSLEDLADFVYFEPLMDVAKIDDYLDTLSEEDLAREFTLNDKQALDILRELPDEHVQKIANDLEIEIGPNKNKTIGQIAMYINQSQYADLMKLAAIKSLDIENIHTNSLPDTNNPRLPGLDDQEKEPKDTEPQNQTGDWEQYINLLLGIVASGNTDNQWADFVWNKEAGDIYYVMPFSEFLNVIDAAEYDEEEGEPSEDDHWRIADQARRVNDWLTIDEYNLNDRWSELAPGNQAPSWLSDEVELVNRMLPRVEAIKNGDLGNLTFDDREAAYHLRRMMDQNEAEEFDSDLDDMIVEIQKRAGIAQVG